MASSPLIERLGEAFFRDIPATPGVYFMLGPRGEVLYIGKATNLRTRLRSYARPPRRADPAKLDRLLSMVCTIRWERLATESEARTRETQLLRGIRPPFNDTHTDRSAYFFITLTHTGARRIRLTMGTNPAKGKVYGCFHFAARVPDAFPALVRLLHIAQGLRAPSRTTRANGCEFHIDPELRSALQLFLSGRSPRLISMLTMRLLDADDFVLRSARNDADEIRRFYVDGPRAARRLRLRYKVPAPLSADAMDQLVSADLLSSLSGRIETQGARPGDYDLGTVDKSVTAPHADTLCLLAETLSAHTEAQAQVETRARVERLIVEMSIGGKGPSAIATELNANGIPRFDGSAWSLWDVVRIIRSYHEQQPIIRRPADEA